VATSGGNVEDRPAEDPRFFDGFVGTPSECEAARTDVLGARYYTPPGIVAAIPSRATAV
jgi:hypothetical protein